MVDGVSWLPRGNSIRVPYSPSRTIDQALPGERPSSSINAVAVGAEPSPVATTQKTVGRRIVTNRPLSISVAEKARRPASRWTISSPRVISHLTDKVRDLGRLKSFDRQRAVVASEQAIVSVESSSHP